MNSWIVALVTNLIKTLFESALEHVGGLAISISMEDAPGLESWLSEHFSLDLAVNVSHTLLDVERVWSSTGRCAHDKVSSFILETLYLSGLVLELEMPLLLFFLAFLVLCESGEEVLALLHLLVRVGMDDTGKILHESEVGTHSICQSCELAELWHKCHFVACLPVLVDQERLVGVSDVLVVSGLVVLGVTYLSSVLVKRG